MKILKLKSILFSLMAITTVTVFLSSCEKNEISPDQIIDSADHMDSKEIQQSENAIDLLLPANVINQGEEAIRKYVSKMTADELSIAAKDFATMLYLENKNKIDEFHDNIKQDGSLLGTNLSEYLSDVELEELNLELDSYTSDEIKERCAHWHCYWAVRIIGTTVIFYKKCIWIS